MIDRNARFVGNVPENYDRYLGPVLFEPYAKDLARRLRDEIGGVESTASGSHRPRILEVACGTGILTRHLLEDLPGTELVATDLNEPMLEFARAKLPEAQGIIFRQADASALPFPDASFDVVVCQFGIMFVPDKEAAMREALRVLRPQGVFLFNVWDSWEKNAFGRIAHETVAAFFPSDPPDFYPVPFGYHRTDEIRASLARSGFTDIRIEAVPGTAESPSARNFAQGLVQGNPIGAAVLERGGSIEKVQEAVTRDLAKAGGERPFRMSVQAFVIAAGAGTD